jgi:hypothetical protein
VVVNKSIVLSVYPYTTSGAVDYTVPLTIENFTPSSRSVTAYQILPGASNTLVKGPAATLTAVPAPAGSDRLDTYKMDYTFPANSVTLLVIPGAKVPPL